MRLTAYTDFSLRVLMYLALNPDRRPTIGEIADRYGASRAHLMKVVHQLGLKGYVDAVRGKSGGLRLARPAAEITIGQVVRDMEPDMALVACFSDRPPGCRISPACRLKAKLAEARAAFMAVLDGCTVAEVTANEAVLTQLLAS